MKKRKTTKATFRKCRTLDSFMKYTKALLYHEGLALILEHCTEKEKNICGEYCGYFYILGCSDGLTLAKKLVQIKKLFIATETLEDTANGNTIYYLDNEVHLVNREKYFLTRNNKEAHHAEYCEMDN